MMTSYDNSFAKQLADASWALHQQRLGCMGQTMSGWGQQTSRTTTGQFYPTANQIAGYHPNLNSDKESQEATLRREYERSLEDLPKLAIVLALATSVGLFIAAGIAAGMYYLWQYDYRIVLGVVGGALWLGGLSYGIYRYMRREIEVEYATKIMAAE